MKKQQPKKIPLNIFQRKIREVTQCLFCFHNHTFGLVGRYDPCFWCKKKHAQVFKMLQTDNCIFFQHDLELLMKEKEIITSSNTTKGDEKK